MKKFLPVEVKIRIIAQKGGDLRKLAELLSSAGYSCQIHGKETQTPSLWITPLRRPGGRFFVPPALIDTDNYRYDLMLNAQSRCDPDRQVAVDFTTSCGNLLKPYRGYAGKNYYSRPNMIHRVKVTRIGVEIVEYRVVEKRSKSYTYLQVQSHVVFNGHYDDFDRSPAGNKPFVNCVNDLYNLIVQVDEDQAA